jgi:hypothetical protein
MRRLPNNSAWTLMVPLAETLSAWLLAKVGATSRVAVALLLLGTPAS